MSNSTQSIETTAKEVPHARGLKIGDIPTAITENHNEVYYFWQNSEIRDATLFHIDAHKDLDDIVAPMESENQRDYYKEMEINSFICPAVHYGIISDGYWFNPQEERFNLRKLELAAAEKAYGPYQRIRWTKSHDKSIDEQEFIDSEKGNNSSLILDIDLDAFSCNGYDPYRIKRYESYGYEERIEQMANFLRQIRDPALITITRSQAFQGKGGETYVDPKLVDKVEAAAIAELKRVYES